VTRRAARRERIGRELVASSGHPLIHGAEQRAFRDAEVIHEQGAAIGQAQRIEASNVERSITFARCTAAST
jgi:hypothetical protein